MKSIIGLVLGGLVLLIGIIVGFSAVNIIDDGERGMVKSFGKVSEVWLPGFHMKVPFRDDITRVDIRVVSGTIDVSAGTRDMQSVHTQIGINFQIDANKIPEIYQRTGVDAEKIAAVITPRVQDVVKAITSNYTSDQLLSQREQIKERIREKLKTEAREYDIILKDVQITDFRFDERYQNAINDKQVAEQNALKAKNDLDRIKVEAEQRIVEAQAEAKAIQIQVEAIRTQGGSEYVQLKTIEKWNGQLPQYTGGSVPLLNIR